ncbi:MAG: hypothetical protein R3A43_01915 [Bacteroidia bacterium]
MKQLIIITLFALTFSSCDFINFQEKANSQFADQHFKTAIANIELFNIRYGQYPTSLDKLDFLGDWDKMIFQSVSYEKLDTGYRLDIVKGIVNDTPTDLKYPKEFWQGLGLKQSNILNYSK